MKKNLQILIVEDNNALLEILNMMINHQFETAIDTLSAASAKEAKLILAKQEIDYCICDHHLEKDCGSDVMKYIIQQKLDTKFVLCSSYDLETLRLEYPREHVFFNIQKPDISEGLDNLITKINNLKRNSAPQTLQHINFIPISIDLCLILEKMPTDIYILSNELNYEKILGKGHEISLEDKKMLKVKYDNKIFAKRHERNDEIIIELNKAINNILASDNIPIGIKISATHSQLKDLINFAGVNEAMAETTKATIREVVTLLLEEKNILAPLNNGNFSETYSTRFYTLHSMLISTVARMTELDSHKDIFKLVLCAFLQDISLKSSQLTKIVDFNEFLQRQKEFSQEEQDEYLNHPQKTLEALELFKGSLYGIDRILLEHHEMPGGKGFPNQLNEIEISPLGALFNLTGILARVLLRDEERFDPNHFLDYMDKNKFNFGRYKDTYDAIKLLLLTNPNNT